MEKGLKVFSNTIETPFEIEIKGECFTVVDIKVKRHGSASGGETELLYIDIRDERDEERELMAAEKAAFIKELEEMEVEPFDPNFYDDPREY